MVASDGTVLVKVVEWGIRREVDGIAIIQGTDRLAIPHWL